MTGQADIPAMGTEQGVERTVRDVMRDRSYGRLWVRQSPDDGQPLGHVRDCTFCSTGCGGSSAT